MKSYNIFFLFLFGLISLGSSAQNNPNFYLHENGVTCMCPNAAVGETGIVKGVTYTKRTRDQITTKNAATTCTSGIKSMAYMYIFQYNNFNGDISSWDVSNVFDMSNMFIGATSFNKPIGNWDVSSVTDMHSMFFGAKAFNQPLGDWDVSSVKDMSLMFNEAIAFNQPINNWNVSNVSTMGYMFYDATSFNQPIEKWNVSNLMGMGYMFYDATSFNQPIGNWDVNKVEDMEGLFYDAISFNQDISKWCVPNLLSEPFIFSIDSQLTENQKPKWGAECTTLSNQEFRNVNTQLTISPNPFTSSVKINLPENIQTKQIQILNAVGQTVYTSAETELNLEHLPSGMYFVKVNTNQGIATEKIIKN